MEAGFAAGNRLGFERFQTVLLFGNNIGIGGTPAGTRNLLRNIHPLLSDSGRVLVTSLDVTQTSNPTHRAYHESNIAAGLPKGQISMRLEYRGRCGPWINWLHPQPQELEAFAQDTGWRIELVRTYDTGVYAAVLGRA